MRAADAQADLTCKNGEANFLGVVDAVDLALALIPPAMIVKDAARVDIARSDHVHPYTISQCNKCLDLRNRLEVSILILSQLRIKKLFKMTNRMNRNAGFFTALLQFAVE